MRGKNTIVINGKVYDALTGLPAGAPDPVTKVAPATPKPVAVKPATGTDLSGVTRRSVPKQAVHRQVQKSATLRRDIISKPNTHQTPIHKARPARPTAHVQRSQMISRFAPHPQPLPAKAPTAQTPAPKPHKQPAPVVRAHQAISPKPAKAERLSSRALKEKMIAQRLSEVEATPGDKQHKAPRKSIFKAQPRVASVLTACFALVILGGYLTYLNMPGLSVRVAAAQAGVDASFPEYRPDGYSLNGPVAYNPGEVSLHFKANGGTKKFTLNQQKSTWDSQAVLDNYVTKQSPTYVANSEQGLTIYTFGTNAAWVNGGILYTIEGDAPLTTDQILNMASSL